VDLRGRAVRRAAARNRRLSGALAAITAAVVGVILNLTVWFALHVLFGRSRSARRAAALVSRSIRWRSI
jgi:chromate transporter